MHFRRRPRLRLRRQGGQSITEFALVLPVFILIVGIGLDFGRVFLGWVNLNSAVRVAANFAAQHPSAWNAANPDVAAQAVYRQLVVNETSGIDCRMPSPLPAPSFPGGTGVGAPAQVSMTCSFGLLTPIVSTVIGNPVPVTALAAFPVRAGVVGDIPLENVLPTPTPTATPAPTPSPTDSGAPPSSSPTPSATATPTPECTVPTLVGTRTNNAQQAWHSAGFTTNVVFNPITPPKYTIGGQSIAPGTLIDCATTTISVHS